MNRQDSKKAEGKMISVEEREQIRRAYLIEGKTQRRIAKELRVSRKTVRKAIEEAGASIYTLSGPRPAPVLDEYKARIEALLAEAERMPRKRPVWSTRANCDQRKGDQMIIEKGTTLQKESGSGYCN